ncbi:MAG: AAA family ATPase [Myxococcales bacterium]|nr:AAA family ATPase [Myxococcales bacterium]
MDDDSRAQLEVELRQLVDVLPEPIRAAVIEHPLEELLEVVLDLGRPPTARMASETVRLTEGAVRAEQLDFVVERVGEFGEDNRAGIERTLHRISAIRNRRGTVVGLTLRAGRAVYGTIDMLRDLVESGLNLLLLGRPGIGKTTKLREVARVLADDFGKRVVVIDTSNEIGGDGDVPHPAIGRARRMQVPRPDRQHAVMIEAVENHMPEAIVIDEIGTEAEAAAARTIAERGVQLIATAHGNTLENLILNPTLSDLVGGVHTVTLSDEEARRRGTQKTITERRAPPTFDIVVELVGRDEVMVHRDTAGAVDHVLTGRPARAERRRRDRGGRIVAESVAAAAPIPLPAPPPKAQEPARLYAHGLSREQLEKAVRALGLEARVVDRLERADVVVVHRSRAEDPRIRHAAETGEVQVYPVKRGTSAELQRVLRGALHLTEEAEDARVREAVAEVEHAIQRVVTEGVSVPLAPRPPWLRRLQHRLITRYHLDSTSIGSEPMRHLVIHPPEAAAEEAFPEEPQQW